MAHTPLERYFSRNVSTKIEKIYKIVSMEQLVSLSDRSGSLDGFAESIGMQESDFMLIINKAKKSIKVYKHSGRRYPLGAF